MFSGLFFNDPGQAVFRVSVYYRSAYAEQRVIEYQLTTGRNGTLQIFGEYRPSKVISSDEVL